MASQGPRVLCNASRHILRSSHPRLTARTSFLQRQFPSAPLSTTSTTPSDDLDSNARDTDKPVKKSKAEALSDELMANLNANAFDDFAKSVDSVVGEPVRKSPRWAETPEGMKAPVSSYVPKNPSRSVWTVNSDPEKLDRFYNRFLGRNGAKMLPEELKWQAITHKSFDQGRRGFNDRLAYFGRQAMILEATRHILTSPPAGETVVSDKFDRTPFQDSSLASVDKLNARLPQDLISRERIESLAIETGLPSILRWKPRLPENLAGSGHQVVLNGAVQAIIGAISLQHGAEVAGRIIRERILKQLAESS